MDMFSLRQGVDILKLPGTYLWRGFSGPCYYGPGGQKKERLSLHEGHKSCPEMLGLQMVQEFGVLLPKRTTVINCGRFSCLELLKSSQLAPRCLAKKIRLWLDPGKLSSGIWLCEMGNQQFHQLRINEWLVPAWSPPSDLLATLMNQGSPSVFAGYVLGLRSSSIVAWSPQIRCHKNHTSQQRSGG